MIIWTKSSSYPQKTKVISIVIHIIHTKSTFYTLFPQRNSVRKEEKMQKKTIIRIIILILIVVWMFSVFQFSDQNGEESSNLSREVASKVVETEEQINQVEPYVRKLAHVTEYTVGGMLFFSLFLTYPFSDKKRMLCAWLVGVEYAAIDEIHQLFIDGRSGQILDVFIDSIGVAIGICVLMLVYKTAKKIFAKRKEGLKNKKEQVV